jgi:hypothetical protein
MIEYLDETVRVTGRTGQQTWPVEHFRANEAACLAEVGGIAEPVPETVSSAQARVALHTAGLLEPIEAIIAAPETPVPVRIFWEYETVFWRESPAINQLAGVAGITQEQLDELFRAAALIVV